MLNTGTRAVFLQCVARAAKASRERNREDLQTETDPVTVFLGELFRLWFLEHGEAYYFVFRKDASETNIQFAELLRLISREVTPRPRYASHAEYRSALLQIVGDCFDIGDATAEPRESGTFEHAYFPLIANTVVIDSFYGSAAVFIPPGCSIVPERVVGLSGYIHSAGRLIGIRDMQKATIEHFSHRYMAYVEKHSNDQRYPVASVASIFSIESYSEDHAHYKLEENQQKAKNAYDRERRVNGLFGMMLSASKCHLGGLPVREAFTRILCKAKIQPRIHDPAIDGEDIQSNSVLWLLCDGLLQADMGKSRDKRYYVLYEQLWKNANQFIVFEENMPAWKANETIPHSLVSAALNLALPPAAHTSDRRLTLIDPFAGTGTTVLQGLKYEAIEGLGTDMSPLSQGLYIDNLQVASLSEADLKDLQSELLRTVALKRVMRDFLASCETALRQEQENHSEDGWLSLLQQQTRFSFRLVAHLARRCFRSGMSLATLESAVISKGLPALLVRLRKLTDVVPKMGMPVTNIPDCHLCAYPGPGFTSVGISQAHLRHELSQETKRVRQQALTTTSDLTAFDLMVADPPYDFNVSNDQTYLLVKTLALGIAEHVRSDGAIVVFLPDRSYTGKRLSPTVSSFAFIGHLLAAVGENHELSLYNEVDRVPTPTKAFRGPFYWRAPRTLDRIALIFRFFRRSGEVP